MEPFTGPHVLLCSRDPAVIEVVEVTAAALDVPVRVTRELPDARAAWPDAALRLVAVEVATRWGRVAPGPAHLVGTSPDDLARCSAELSLPVLPLPDEHGRLAAAMSTAVQVRAPRGSVVALMGASGGLGVSTLTVSLALLAARAGQRCVGVELTAGGGLDLLVGAETDAGLRWSDVGQARGELGDVLAGLPSVDGASFLAISRQEPAAPSPQAVAAVLGSLARSADLVVVDAGREAPPPECDALVLVVGADVRSVAAARMLATSQRWVPTGLVVRTGRGRTLPAEAVASSLGAPTVGVLPDDHALPRLAELGLAPVGGPARRYRRRVGALLKELTHA